MSGRLVLVGEGHGERGALENLVAKVGLRTPGFAETFVGFHPTQRRTIRGPHDAVRAVEVAARYAPAGVVLTADLDDDCPATCAPRVGGRGPGARSARSRGGGAVPPRVRDVGHLRRRPRTRRRPHRRLRPRLRERGYPRSRFRIETGEVMGQVEGAGGAPRLAWLQASNYRSVGAHVTVEFGDLTVLVGPNGAGKSSLIDVYASYVTL